MKITAALKLIYENILITNDFDSWLIVSVINFEKMPSIEGTLMKGF